MIFKKTKIKDCFEIDLDKKKDNRGFFARLFCQNEFKELKLNNKILQINNSFTKKSGTLRGLHYQKYPHQETKIIRCISGSIYDVIVDLRKNSNTYLKYHSVILSEKNRKMLYVPKGCAHGFLSLKNNSEVFYLVSSMYNPKSEKGLNYKDPKIGIKWPIKITSITEKDNSWEYL